jgi:AraC-like DNA-binding protein
METEERVEEFAAKGGRVAQDNPHRHGCVLRICRTARQSGIAWQAGRGRRVARARRRRGGKLTAIGRIAREAGFKSVPGFSNMFKKHYGMSPSKFSDRSR